MEWYIVYRCQNDGEIVYGAPVDGVRCSLADQAIRISSARVFLHCGEYLTAFRCKDAAEIELAKQWERTTKLAIDDLIGGFWSRTEFIDFMCMPAFEGSYR